MGIDTTFSSDFTVFFFKNEDGFPLDKETFKKLKKESLLKEYSNNYWKFVFDEEETKIVLKENSVGSSPFYVIPHLFTILNKALALGIEFHVTPATFVDDFAAGVMMISSVINSNILVRVVRTISFIEDPKAPTYILEYSLLKYNKSDKNIESIVKSIHEKEIRLK